MSKQYYFCKLIPPRATFIQDMNAEERALMGQHTMYTRQHFAEGKILIYGPVMDAGWPFGMAVFQAANEAEVRQILENDPTVLAGLNKFEISPMMLGGAQGSEK
jgi:uncharacterized protein YciI